MCEHRPPYTPVRPLLGTCGMGTVHRVLFTIPAQLQETYFRETMVRSDSNPFDFRWCPSDFICVDAVTEGSSICHFDDGGPLYTFKCGTRIPDCVYGVASYAEMKEEIEVPANQRGRKHCNAGSYFSSVPHHYHWIARTMLEG
ncbi:uncharacterized protein LOC142335166 [Convolutriloba macropyga]|uniref:uncharacterized protein LOC142335166 n=1 Tax=Convolutriloba macropyga TaxID=536237 RepID=UPI003F51DEB6